MCKAELLGKENIIEICKDNNYICASCKWHINIKTIKPKEDAKRSKIKVVELWKQ